MYCNRFDSVDDFAGEPGLFVVPPSNCCVKSIRKLVVSSRCPIVAGVFCLLGVGDGDREGDERFRDVGGVNSAFPRGVPNNSDRFVGL